MSNFKNRTRNTVISVAVAAGILVGGVTGANYLKTNYFDKQDSIPAISMPANPVENKPVEGTGFDKVEVPSAKPSEKQESRGVMFNRIAAADYAMNTGDILKENLGVLAKAQEQYQTELGWKDTGKIAVTGHKIFVNSKGNLAIWSGSDPIVVDLTAKDLEKSDGAMFNLEGFKKKVPTWKQLRSQENVKLVLEKIKLVTGETKSGTVSINGSMKVEAADGAITNNRVSLEALTGGRFKSVEDIKARATENGSIGDGMVTLLEDRDVKILGNSKGQINLSVSDMLTPWNLNECGLMQTEKNGKHIMLNSMDDLRFEAMANGIYGKVLKPDDEFKTPVFTLDEVVTVSKMKNGETFEVVAMENDGNGKVMFSIDVLRAMCGVEFAVVDTGTTASAGEQCVDMITNTGYNTIMTKFASGREVTSIKNNEFDVQMEKLRASELEKQDAARAKVEAEQQKAKEKFEQEQQKKKEEEQKRQEEEKAKQEEEEAGQVESGGGSGGSGSGSGSGGGQNGGGHVKEPHPMAEDSAWAECIRQGGIEIVGWREDWGGWEGYDIGGVHTIFFPGGGAMDL